MIVLGIILILVGYLLPAAPVFIIDIGWLLVVIGIVLLVLGRTGRPVGGRRYWY